MKGCRYDADKVVIGVVFTLAAVVIGHTAEGCQQGNVNKAVNVIADYLEGMNMWEESRYVCTLLFETA